MVHTKVETILGLTVDSRDSGGLSAEASTARPNVVRRSSHARPTAACGHDDQDAELRSGDP